MSYCVYKHTFPNGKVYIGITSQNVKRRWRKNGEGYCQKRSGEYTQSLMAHAINKYGWDNILHEILFDGLTKEEAEEKEQELIIFYNSNNSEYGYNIANGGRVNSISEETKRKISKSHKGKKLSEQHKRRIGESGKGHPTTLKGRPISQEHKEKIRKAMTGNKNPFYGKHHSEETKKKMSEAHEMISKGDKNPNAKITLQYDLNMNLIHVYNYAKQAANKLHINVNGITNCCIQYSKSSNGFIWKYLYDATRRNGTIIKGAISLGLITEEEALNVLKEKGFNYEIR